MKLFEANDDAIKAAAFLVKEGGVVVYPTETVYGIGCIPSDPDAAQRICEIKERADKPLPLICSDIEMVRKIVVMTSAAEKLAAKFWPGPLTIVLVSKVKYSTWVTHGASTLGVRVTEHPVAQKLAKAVRSGFTPKKRPMAIPPKLIWATPSPIIDSFLSITNNPTKAQTNAAREPPSNAYWKKR